MPYSIQAPLFALNEFWASDQTDRLVLVLGALELDPLLHHLDRRHGRGRRGYELQTLLQAVIAGWVYGLPSIAELRRELLRNGSLRLLCGIPSVGRVPSEDAFSRFFTRLAQCRAAVDALHATVIGKIRALAPEVGARVAIDSTAIPAWAEGNRARPADPDARWGCKGHKTKGKSQWWFGYKLHLAVDTQAELALSYTLTPANVHDTVEVPGLLDRLGRIVPPGQLAAVIADAAYDSEPLYATIWAAGALPIIDFNARGWAPPVGMAADGCPLCPCGHRMRYLGRDRAYIKYGSGRGCRCRRHRRGRFIQRWRIDANPRLHPPLPRHTKKWQRLYDERTAVERVNSRGKEHGRLRSLRHRGLAKAHLHCALTLLIQAAGCLGMMQAGHREWARSVVRLVA